MFRFLFKVQCNVVVVRFTALYHSKKIEQDRWELAGTFIWSQAEHSLVGTVVRGCVF